MMRGAWQAGYEYLFELHTEREQVGCDGFPAHVIVLEYNHRIGWSELGYGVLEEAGNGNCP
jgi:hypothetical protein